MLFVGATLAYAGILTLADNLYVGVGMVISGSVLIAIPMWKAFCHYWNPSTGVAGFPITTKKGRRKGHLKVLNGKKEERRTYH